MPTHLHPFLFIYLYIKCLSLTELHVHVQMNIKSETEEALSSMKELEGIVTSDQEIQSQQVTFPTPSPLALTSELPQRDIHCRVVPASCAS